MIRKRNPIQLWQEIVFTLSLKALLLFVLWAVFFSAPPVRINPDRTDDGRQVAAHIFSQQNLKETNHDADTRTR